MGSQLSITDQIVLKNRKTTRSELKLSKISSLVDWDLIERDVKQLYPVNKQGGRPVSDLSVKIKMLFIQHLYNLSDPELEDHMNDRLSFQKFCGLSIEESIIDFTTFWRFKEKIGEVKLADKIFTQVNATLESKGLIVKKGTCIDATIIESGNKPLSHKKREELAETPSSQIDTDASSTAKRGSKYFGYKGHIGTDVGSKLIRKKEFTTASPHDSQTKEELYSGDEKAVFGDSAYSNQADKRKCRKKGIYYGILDKSTRRRKLSKTQKKRNKQKSSIRSSVEHPFAYMKCKLNYQYARAKNVTRNELTFTMNCVIYNIMRGDYLLKKTS